MNFINIWVIYYLLNGSNGSFPGFLIHIDTYVRREVHGPSIYDSIAKVPKSPEEYP
jgi:hypothetical protein